MKSRFTLTLLVLGLIIALLAALVPGTADTTTAQATRIPVEGL